MSEQTTLVTTVEGMLFEATAAVFAADTAEIDAADPQYRSAIYGSYALLLEQAAVDNEDDPARLQKHIHSLTIDALSQGTLPSGHIAELHPELPRFADARLVMGTVRYINSLHANNEPTPADAAQAETAHSGVSDEDDDHGRSDQQILEAIQSGDTAAFAELYARYHDGILNIMSVYFPEEAEDIASETFTKILGFILRGNEISFPRTKSARSYFKTVALNIASDIIGSSRYKNTQIGLDDTHYSIVDPTHSVEELALEHLDAESLEKAIRRLTTDQQEVIIARYYGDLTPTEIAPMINNTLNATKALQHRGIRTLAKILYGLRSADRVGPGPRTATAA